MKNCLFAIIINLIFKLSVSAQESWIRTNLLGYPTSSVKVAVWASKGDQVKAFDQWSIVDAKTNKTIKDFNETEDFDAYGPFNQVKRLNFTEVKNPGTYYVKAGEIRSQYFVISDDIYNGAADFVLQYMRQQRCGFNPYLKDSCHLDDGYTFYGPMPDSTKQDVTGGWHDATDYLQYSITSANATFHLLAAYRDFKEVFTDQHQANGLEGINGIEDVLDEAKWGLEWLLKMHPQEDWLFNQIADDRDHAGMRLPNKDTVDYGFGPGKGRPVYFANGEVQGLGKFKNNGTGVASVAGKFSSALGLGALIYENEDKDFASLMKDRSFSSYGLGLKKPGVQQTASVKAPYIYMEGNWVDDRELAAAVLHKISGEKKYADQALNYAEKEPVIPWMYTDTAGHYELYPFHNIGHYELAKNLEGSEREKLISYLKEGIEQVWSRASKNGFLRGVPFIWCSNNLTTSFAIQCYQYRQLSGDETYLELEQANFDWLLGVNPWGTSMIVGFPENADHPVDPHSSFTHLYQYPVNGGLVDGPIYGKTFNNLLGLSLHNPDQYAPFQSDLVVYHDDVGDYSTNEPTMDGTASLVYLFAAKDHEALKNKNANKKSSQ
ncbi:hypothetical protein BH23BAC1_BH23BAC1_15960 [soil metagenome]